jgi:23S rRNA (guanine745-N1)-methyltransferase
MKDVWSTVKLKGKAPRHRTATADAAEPGETRPSEHKQAAAGITGQHEDNSAVATDAIANNAAAPVELTEASCWRCPVCSEPLMVNGRSFQCSKRHSFDQAKEGYTNLLLANKKNSAEPGDSKDMLLGRRAFLEQGFYAPLADQLATLISLNFPDQSALRILDAGCGEGYYPGRIAEQLNADHQFIGIDISRAAMRMAGKRYPDMQLAVASSYELPLADQSVDVLLRVFAPVPEEEVARVLKPGGLYLWVHPGEQHLFELRALIYDQPQLHTVADDKPTTEGLVWQSTETVNYPFHLPDSEAVKGLLAMTPYYWSASKEKQQACEALPELDLRADFRISVLKKRVG